MLSAAASSWPRTHILLGHAEPARRLRRHLDPGEPVADLEEILQHRFGLGAERIELAQAIQSLFDRAAGHMLEQVQDPRAIGQTEHGLDLRRRDPGAGAGERDRLIQQRQPVAHRTLGGAHDERERPRLDLHPFLRGDPFEMALQQLALDPPQIEALTAGEHRDRDLAHFGGGEDEDRLRRRLLQRLQQAVEGLLGEHVHFVDDVDLVARGARGVPDAVHDLADVVDAGAGRRVHLEHVDVPPFGDRDTRLARLRMAPASARRPPVQFSARAMIRAVVVLPTPRIPVRRNACATRPLCSALLRVRTSASCPISSEKRCGR